MEKDNNQWKKFNTVKTLVIFIYLIQLVNNCFDNFIIV